MSTNIGSWAASPRHRLADLPQAPSGRLVVGGERAAHWACYLEVAAAPFSRSRPTRITVAPLASHAEGGRQTDAGGPSGDQANLACHDAVLNG